MQSKMQRLHLSFIRKLRKLKLMQELLLKILIYLVVVAISIAIITTSPMLGGLIILAFTVLYAIPILVEQIKEIIKNIDK